LINLLFLYFADRDSRFTKESNAVGSILKNRSSQLATLAPLDRKEIAVPKVMTLATLFVACLAIGAAPEAGDLGKLQGSWEASVGRKGEFTVAIEIKGREVSATISSALGPKLRASGELELDENRSPRALDWVKFSTLDGQEVPTIHAIYRLEQDRLILRSGGLNDDRPKAFESGGTGCWSEVLVFNRPNRPAKTGTD
jgi:uncharacterized protein (TIGR03067 family)